MINFLKVCFQYQCVESSLAPVGDCVFGDDLIVDQLYFSQKLPYSPMSCEDALAYLASIGIYAYTSCLDKQSQFYKACCSTCKSKWTF